MANGAVADKSELKSDTARDVLKEVKSVKAALTPSSSEPSPMRLVIMVGEVSRMCFSHRRYISLSWQYVKPYGLS